MNERDSELVAHDLIKNGYELVPKESEADVVLLNTCSVREQAEQKAIGKANNLLSKSRKNKRSETWNSWLYGTKPRIKSEQ